MLRRRLWREPIMRIFGLLLCWCGPPGAQEGREATIKGGLQCNGMCVPDPRKEDHVMVVFAVDGSPEIAARVRRIMDEHYPEKGLDAEAAEKLQDQWIAHLKFFISPASTAEVPDPNRGRSGHYCHASRPVTITGAVTEADGKKWIRASRVSESGVKHPDRMLMEDRPFVPAGKETLVLKITDAPSKQEAPKRLLFAMVCTGHCAAPSSTVSCAAAPETIVVRHSAKASAQANARRIH